MRFHTPGDYHQEEHQYRQWQSYGQDRSLMKELFGSSPRQIESPSEVLAGTGSIFSDKPYLNVPMAQDFVTGLISDKSRFARAAAIGLERQVQERIQLKEHNLQQIQYDSCTCGTLLEELFVWGDRALSHKRRQTLDMVLFGLEHEKRAEEVSCWRDISLLKEKFVQAVAYYTAAYRREQLFNQKPQMGD